MDNRQRIYNSDDVIQRRVLIIIIIPLSPHRLLSQTTLRNILGTKNLHEILSDREGISGAMQVTAVRTERSVDILMMTGSSGRGYRAVGDKS